MLRCWLSYQSQGAAHSVPDTFRRIMHVVQISAVWILLSKSLALAHVFAVREHKLCLQSLVLLEESVILDEFFLRRLSETSHDKVICLAAARKSAHVQTMNRQRIRRLQMQQNVP